MIALQELLNAKKIPNDLELSREDLLTLVRMHKGLLRENERNLAFWRSTNKNLERVTQQLKKTNQEVQEMRDQLWGEMQLAKKIQTVLLPKQTFIEGYEITAFMNPADEVGGDYYDVINTKERDWIAIGDVSGHGVSAGLVMMMVQTSIRVALHLHNDPRPSELLTLINRAISDNIRKMAMAEAKYMTITVMAAFEHGHFRFSGLHQDIMIYRNRTQKVDRVSSEGAWLGIVDDISDMVRDQCLTLEADDIMLLYTDEVQQRGCSSSSLEADDIMLLYTDGIIEAWKKGTEVNPCEQQKDMFGEERLI